MSAFLVVALAGLATYGLRVSMLLASGRRRLPGLLLRSTPLVVPATFAAVVAGAVATRPASGSPVAPLLLALGVAVVAARRSGRSHVGLLVGMPTLWLAAALL